MRCPPSIWSCRRRRTWRSVATPSAAASPAWPPRNRMRPTPRSSCSATRSTRPAAPERTEARIAHWPDDPLPGPAPVGRVGSVRQDRPPARVRAEAPARGAGHLSPPRAHPQAGPRGRPRPHGGLPARDLGATRRADRRGSRPPQYEFALVSTRQGPYPDRPPAPATRVARPNQPHVAAPTPTAAGPPACSPASPPRPGRRSARSPRRPGRKELHCECCQAASRRSSSRPSRRSSSSASSDPRPPWPPTRQVWRASCTPWARSSPAATTTARNPTLGRVRQVPDHALELAVMGGAATSATRVRGRRPPTRRSWRPASSARLYRGLESWRRVAYWWLTGSSRTTGWSTYATRYVSRVMTHLPRARRPRPSAPVASSIHRYSETSSKITYSARGARRAIRAYAGDAAKYSTKAGATASFAFSGKKVIWYGPVGPTRGKARILIDGTYVKTVNLYRELVHGPQGRLQQELVDGRRAHPGHRGGRHRRTPVRRDRRLHGRRLADGDHLDLDP